MVTPQYTPNPRSMKFVLSQNVMNEGKATFTTPEQAQDLVMVQELLKLPMVEQVYLFENTVTVTQEEDEWDTLAQMVKAVLITRMPLHNPNIDIDSQKRKLRETLPPEIQKIEEILDRTVRPGLKSDGGNIQIIELKGKDLIVKYEGACGGCPSSTEGTLRAIEGILQNEYDPEIIVTPMMD